MDGLGIFHAPSLSLPRSAGEGTLTIRVSGSLDADGALTPSPALAGEGWGGGL